MRRCDAPPAPANQPPQDAVNESTPDGILSRDDVGSAGRIQAQDWGEPPMMTRILGRGESEKQYTARGSVMNFKALAELDGGDFSLMERTLDSS